MINTNNFQGDIFYQLIGPQQVVLPIRVTVDQEAMAMKGYSTHLRTLELDPYHWMQFKVLLRRLALIQFFFPLAITKS